jgi:hypothetical protein
LSRLFFDCVKILGKPIWKVFGEGKPSEYELYFNYAKTFYKDYIKERYLHFESKNKFEIVDFTETDCDFIVYHYHNRYGFSGNHDNGDYLYHVPINSKNLL